MSLSTAFSECQSMQIGLSLDWFQLSLKSKGQFLDMAKDHNYKDPKHPLGRSRGYCFYLGLQRMQKNYKANM